MSRLEDIIEDMENFKILIVDDKTNMRRTIRNMLRYFRFSSFGEAADGDVAWRMLHEDSYDLVICDWNMPRMKGVELLRNIRQDESLEETPFLMVSGELYESRVAEVIEAEVDGYVVKPFDYKTLEDRLVTILGKKKSEPGPLEAQLMLAKHYLEVGAYYQSHMELDRASEITKKTPKLHYLRGLTFEAEGRDEEAEKSYETARIHGSRFVPVYDRLADLKARQGRTEEVIALLEKAAAISPNSADRQARLGDALMAADRQAEAQKAFIKALRLAPTNTELANQIGDAFISMEKNDEAEAVFRSCIKVDPSQIYAYNRLGMVLRRKKKFKEAIMCYKKALELAPQDENLHFNLARAYIGANMRPEAIGELNEAMVHKPEFREAKILLTKLESSRK